MNQTPEEQIEDLRAALCMAQDEIEVLAAELEDTQGVLDECELDNCYHEDLLGEIRALCSVPWDVRTADLPEYLRVRMLLNDEAQKNGQTPDANDQDC